MLYFSGVTWGLSERPFLMVFLKNQSVLWVSPAFEERSARYE
jgi:hypothetical protein